MIKKLGPFDVQKIILKKLPIPENVLDGYSQWMMNKIFSCDESLAFYARFLDSANLPDKVHFDFLYYGIPKINRFIPYLAKKKKEDDEAHILAKHFGVSPSHGAQYVKMISEKELNYIKELYEHKQYQRRKKK